MKRWLIWLTTIVMLFSFMALPAMAEENPEEGEITQEVPDEEFSEENEGSVGILEDAEPAEELPEEDEDDGTEAYAPDDLEKTIFGKDDRFSVKPSNYPYSAIAYMEVTAQCGCSWAGTGLMVNKHRMLTAAHCLVCTKHGKWAKNLKLYFGYSSKKKYVYKYSGKWYAWVGDTFKNKSYRMDWDYACVRLYKNVGNKTGWFKADWSASDSKLKSKWITVAGYRDGKLKAAVGTVQPYGYNHLSYTIDTLPGTSGGPIFDNDYRVYGINIAQSEVANYGYRLGDLVKYVYKKVNK